MASASTVVEALSFDFGLSLVTEEYLDTYAKYKCETVPKPLDDEVVVFWEFFLVGLQFSVIPFVLEVLKTFRVRFPPAEPLVLHQDFCFCVGV